MIDVLMEIWLTMQEYEFFYYVPCLAVICGLLAIFRDFTGKEVHI